MAAFTSDKGSIADRMRSLSVRSDLLLKAGPADPNAAMAAADPATPPGDGLANTQPIQDQSLVPPPVVPASAAGKMYYDEVLALMGQLGSLLGQRPGLMAQWASNGMPSEGINQFDMAFGLAKEKFDEMFSLMAALQKDPQIMTMLEYDAPVQAPNMTEIANPNVANPPVNGLTGALQGMGLESGGMNL